MALGTDSMALNVAMLVFSSALGSTFKDAFNVTFNDAFDNYFAAKFLLQFENHRIVFKIANSFGLQLLINTDLSSCRGLATRGAY